LKIQKVKKLSNIQGIALCRCGASNTIKRGSSQYDGRRNKKMLENKVKKFNNLELHLSYKVLAGKPENEVIKFSEESDIDLIVMASSRISSTIRVIGSTVRKVIDSTSKHFLVIH
jgi:nucleotide-binding universal stress UspA family protein